MRKCLSLFFAVCFFASCNQVGSVKNPLRLPELPAAADAVKTEIKGQRYAVSDVGVTNARHASVAEWASASTDTTPFYRNYMAERKAFAMRFVNDSSVEVSDENKIFTAGYFLAKDTAAGLLLQIQYADSSFSFNPGEVMTMTSTYKIRGADDNALFLETPREMNGMKVVVLMRKE